MEGSKKDCEKDSKSSSLFDIRVVVDEFTKCSEGGLGIDPYITAYEELCVFFNLLGSVFGFITSDVKEKIEILRHFRSGASYREQYEKVEKMFTHEIEKNKEAKKGLLGSRTLLRLHRALSFTMLFMERLSESSNNDKTSAIASTAYSETLSKFHPWLIRKAAMFAMYTLPTRGDILLMLGKDMGESQEVQFLLKQCVNAIRPVYEQVDELYTKYELHELP
eukprot:gene15403-16975_t